MASFFARQAQKKSAILVVFAERELYNNSVPEKWEEMSVEEHVEYYINMGKDKKEAMKAAAKDRGVSKREIYNDLINNE